MAEKITGTKLVLGGVQKTVITPYASDGVTLGSDYYTLTDCVEGTTVIEQAESETTEILNEQGGVIKSLPTLGTRTFTTNSGDIQESVLTGLFGYWVHPNTGALIAPTADPGILAKVEVYFAGGTHRATCAQVSLANSLTIESLNEGIAQGVITGTLLNVTVDAVEADSSAGTEAVDAYEWSFAIEPVTAS